MVTWLMTSSHHVCGKYIHQGKCLFFKLEPVCWGLYTWTLLSLFQFYLKIDLQMTLCRLQAFLLFPCPSHSHKFVAQICLLRQRDRRTPDPLQNLYNRELEETFVQRGNKQSGFSRVFFDSVVWRHIPLNKSNTAWQYTLVSSGEEHLVLWWSL